MLSTALLRAQAPGELDLSFDGDGKLVIAAIDSMGDPFAVPTADLGMIIGFNRTVDGQQQTCLLRLNEDGSVNTAFADQGLMVSTAPLELKDVLIRADGKVMLVGLVPGQLQLRVERYLADGLADLSFGSNGAWELHLPDSFSGPPVSSGLMLPDDRILVNGSFGVLRVLADGGLDMSFGVDGVYAQGGKDKLALAPDGTIRWTEVTNSTPLFSDYHAQVSGFSIDMNSSCGASGSLSGDLVINGQGRFLASLKTCSYFPSGPFAYEYNVASISSINNLSGVYHPSILFDMVYCDFYYQMGHRIGNSTDFKLSVDGADSFYSAFALRREQRNDWNEVSITYFFPGWSIRKYASSGVRTSWSDGVEQIQTKFIDADSTENLAEYPTPSSMFSTADGKLMVVGYCEIDGVKRIVAARYHASPDPRCRAHVRVMLGGNYDSSTGLMRDDLRAAGLVPQLAPYDAPHYLMANGRGAFATSASVLAWEGDTAVVDWVWLELMHATEPGSVVATRVGLLHRNGWVTQADGRSAIDFGIGEGAYLLRVRHRNHLSATTLNAVALGVEPTIVDLSQPATATFGVDAQKEIFGVRMLWPGQTNNDGVVRYAGSMNDRDEVLQAIGGLIPTATITGYQAEDLNLDGVVKYTGTANDRDLILQTIGGVVPTAVRVEQTP